MAPVNRTSLMYRVLSIHRHLMGAVVLLLLLIKPGSTFKLYDIFNHKRHLDYQRLVPSDNTSPVVSTLQCIADKCPHLEISQMLENPQTIEECVSQCLPQDVADDVQRRAGENGNSLGREVPGLRSREVDALGSCIEAKCVGRPYPACVFEECMSQLHLGKKFRRESVDPDVGHLLSGLMEADDKEKRGRTLGRRQIEKRVGEACATCYPRSDHFPGCRIICA